MADTSSQLSDGMTIPCTRSFTRGILHAIQLAISVTQILPSSNLNESLLKSGLLKSIVHEVLRLARHPELLETATMHETFIMYSDAALKILKQCLVLKESKRNEDIQSRIKEFRKRWSYLRRPHFNPSRLWDPYLVNSFQLAPHANVHPWMKAVQMIFNGGYHLCHKWEQDNIGQYRLLERANELEDGHHQVVSVINLLNHPHGLMNGLDRINTVQRSTFDWFEDLMFEGVTDFLPLDLASINRLLGEADGVFNRDDSDAIWMTISYSEPHQYKTLYR